MRNRGLKVVVTVLAILFGVLNGFPQTPAEELTRLKEHLGIDEEAAVSLGSASEFQKTSGSLKVFLAMGLDMKVRENFVRNIEKWNKSGDARKYQVLEIVDEISAATIILSRYTLNDQARTNTGSTSVASSVWDPATNSTVTRPTQRTYSYSTVPVYAYVILRSQDKYKIISRYSGSASQGEYRNSGADLWDDFKKVLKRS